MSAADTVAGWARALGELETLPERLGGLAAPGVEAAAMATASAGTTPSGAPWAPTASGGRAMAGAAGAVAVEGRSDGVAVRLTGPEAFHHAGAGGEPRRQVIPDDGEVPDGYARAVDEAFEREAALATGGA